MFPNSYFKFSNGTANILKITLGTCDHVDNMGGIAVNETAYFISEGCFARFEHLSGYLFPGIPTGTCKGARKRDVKEPKIP